MDLNYSKFIYQKLKAGPVLGAVANVIRNRIDRKMIHLDAKIQRQLIARLEKKIQTAKGLELKRYKLLREYIFRNNVNNRIKEIKASPKYIALGRIKDKKDAMDAFILFDLIEKKWDINTAYVGLGRVFTKKGYDIFQLLYFFREENAAKKLGFYWGEKWKSWDYYNKIAFTRKKSKGWRGLAVVKKDPAKKRVLIRSWWTVDNNGDDECMHTNSIIDAFPGIKKELIKDPVDSGFDDIMHGRDGKVYSPAATQIINYLETAIRVAKKHEEYYPTDWAKDLYKHFNDNKKRYTNTWSPLDNSDTAGQMSMYFGEGCENYLYRYDPKKGKVYFISIIGRLNKSEWGYIPVITEKKVTPHYKKLGKWIDKSSDLEFLKKELLDEMTVDEMDTELGNINVQNRISAVARIKPGEELKSTIGLVSYILNRKGLYKVSSYFKYKKMKTHFLAPLEDAVEKYLKKHTKLSDVDVKAAAKARRDRVEKDINVAIENNKPLYNYLSFNPKIKVKFTSKDTVEVDFHNPNQKKRAEKLYEKKREVLEKAKKAEKAKGILGKIKGKIQSVVEKILKKTKLGKYAGIVAGFITNAIVGFLDLGSLVKDWISGKYAWITGALGGGGILAGFKLKGKRLTKAKLEKLTKNKSKYIFQKNYKVSQRIDLGRSTIVIADGKNFHPLEGMQIRVNGGAVQKVKKRKTFGFLGILLGGGGKDYKGKKIEIVKFLPKGFKIKKGSVWHK